MNAFKHYLIYLSNRLVSLLSLLVQMLELA